MKTLRIFSILLLVAGSCFASPYRVLQSVSVRGAKVHLSDIFPLAHRLPECRPFAGVVISSSPAPGAWMELSGSFVRARLRESGALSCLKVLSIPRSLRVSRSSVKIDEKKLLEIARKFIGSCFDGSKLRYEIEYLRPVPKSVVLPEGNVSYRCFMPSKGSFWGNGVFPIVFYVDGKEVKKVWVYSGVRVFAKVVIAARGINLGHIIRPEDLTLGERDVTSLNSKYFSRVGDVIGKRAKRFIFPGSIVRSDFIDTPPVVRRGDRVVILLDTDTIRVTAPGIAEEDGRVGDIIKVENVMSKKVIFGEVRDGKRVVVRIQ